MLQDLKIPSTVEERKVALWLRRGKVGLAAANGPGLLTAPEGPRFSCGKGVTHTSRSRAAGLYFLALFGIRND